MRKKFIIQRILHSAFNILHSASHSKPADISSNAVLFSKTINLSNNAIKKKSVALLNDQFKVGQPPMEHVIKKTWIQEWLSVKNNFEIYAPGLNKMTFKMLNVLTTLFKLLFNSLEPSEKASWRNFVYP